MKGRPFGLIVFLCLFTSMEARIGETLDQCVARYGKPQKVREHGPEWLTLMKMGGADAGVFFRKGDFLINVTFFEGKADHIAFAKTGLERECTDEELLTLLKANAGGADWEQIGPPDSDITKQWKTRGGTLMALYNYDVLTITTEGYRQRLKAKFEADEAAKKAKDASKLQGF